MQTQRVIPPEEPPAESPGVLAPSPAYWNPLGANGVTAYTPPTSPPAFAPYGPVDRVPSVPGQVTRPIWDHVPQRYPFFGQPDEHIVVDYNVHYKTNWFWATLAVTALVGTFGFLAWEHRARRLRGG